MNSFFLYSISVGVVSVAIIGYIVSDIISQEREYECWLCGEGYNDNANKEHNP